MLLASLFLVVGTVWADLVDGGVYSIINKYYSRAISEDNGYLRPVAQDAVNYNQLWLLETTGDGAYTLQNVVSGRYMKPVNQMYAVWQTATGGTNLYLGIQTAATGDAPDYYYISMNETPTVESGFEPCAHDDNNGKVVGWTHTAEASQWAFVQKEIEMTTLVANAKSVNALDSDIALAEQLDDNTVLSGSAEHTALIAALNAAQSLGEDDLDATLDAIVALKTAIAAAELYIQKNDITYITELPTENSNHPLTVTCPRSAWAVANGGTSMTTIGQLSLAASEADLKQQFAIITPDGGENHYIYSVNAQRYLKSDNTFCVQGEAIQLNDASSQGENRRQFQFKGKSIYINISGNVLIDTWSKVDEGNACEIVQYNTLEFDLDYALKIFNEGADITVKYMHNGAELLREEDLLFVGDTKTIPCPWAYTDIASVKVNGVELAAPAEGADWSFAIDEAGHKEVIVNLAYSLPFTLSEEGGDKVWHLLQIRGNKWVAKSATVPYPNNTTRPTTVDGLWAFSGNPVTGIIVYNLGAEEGNTLGVNNGNVVMASGVTKWTLGECWNSGALKGFLLRQGTEGSKYVHDLSSNLKIWDSNSAPTDVGSAFVVTEVMSLVAATKSTALADIDGYDEFDYYGYSDEAIETALATVQGCKVNDPTTVLTELVSIEEAMATLRASELQTVAPADGARIVLKNRQHGTWLGVNASNNLCGVAAPSARRLFEFEHVWTLKATSEEGVYNLYNEVLDVYAGPLAEKDNTVSPVKNDPETAGKYVFEQVNGQMYAALRDTHLDVNERYMHHSTWNSKEIVRWNASANASQWIISDVATYTRKQLAEIVADTAAATDFGALPLQASDKDAAYYLSSCGSADGHLESHMLDGDPATFYGSPWQSIVGSKHYWQVDLGDGVTLSEFIFSYTTRANGSDTPAEITVVGSNDGVAFSDTLATITEGLPSTASGVYTSGVISNDGGCRYLRFYAYDASGYHPDGEEKKESTIAIAEFSMKSTNVEGYTAEQQVLKGLLTAAQSVADDRYSTEADIKKAYDDLFVYPVTVIYKYNDEELGRVETSVDVRFESKTYVVTNPYSGKFLAIGECTANDVPLEIVNDTCMVELTEATTIMVTLADNFPFKAAADYKSITHWYYLNIRDDIPTYMYYEAGVDYIKATASSVPADAKDAYTWGFVGNAIDGISIVNKAAGETMVLSSPEDPTENKIAAQLARMVTKEGATGNTAWTILVPTHTDRKPAPVPGAFYVQHPTATAFAFNRQGYNGQNTVCYWNDRDTGSDLQVVERNVTDLSELINNQVYTLESERSPLLYSALEATKLSSGLVGGIAADRGDVNQQFLILRTESTPTGQYYLYSIGAQKFVAEDLTFTDELPSHALAFEPYAGKNSASYPWWVKIAEKYVITGNGGTAGNKIYHTDGGDDDEGKRFKIGYGGYYDASALTTLIGQRENEGTNRARQELYTAIYQASSLETKDYILTEGLAEAREEAQQVYDNTAATYGELVEQYEKLTAAIAAAHQPEYDQLANGVTYTFVTKRGWMGASSDGANVIASANGVETDLNFLWTVYKSANDKYYLYNVGKRMFVGVASADAGEIPFAETPQSSQLTFKKTDVAGYPIMFTTDQKGAVNIMTSKKVIRWDGGLNNTKDDGNSHKVTIIGKLQDDILADIASKVESFEAVTVRQEFIQAIEEAIVAAQAKIDAASDAPGYYSSNNPNVEEDLEAIKTFLQGITAETTIEAIKEQMTEAETIATSFAINLPKQGKFYRIKNDNGTGYLSGNAQTSDRVQFVANIGEQASSIFYFEEGKLLSYATGLYLAKGSTENFVHYTTSIGVGAGIDFTFKESKVTGKLLIGFNNDGRSFYSDGVGESNAASANQDADHYRFTVEEVTTLPVTVSAAGWATLYAPVALEIPAEVMAYTAIVAEDYVSLKEIEGGVIPANTGVMIKAEQGTYDFEVTTSETTAGSDFTGAYAKSVKNAGAKVYTLQNPSGKGVGFYLFKGQNSEGKTTYINGFRAWVELPIEASAPSLRIRFAGAGTTAIDKPAADDEDAVIYDLTGRRIEKIVEKGIYIVNGVKVVID